MFTSTTPTGKMFIGILLASAFFLFSVVSIASVNLQPNAGENITSSLLPFFGKKVNLQTSSKSKLKVQLNPIGSASFATNQNGDDLFAAASISPNNNNMLTLGRVSTKPDNKYSIKVWSSDGLNMIYSKDDADPAFFDQNNKILGLRAGKEASLEVYDFDTGKTVYNLPNPKYYDGSEAYDAVLLPYLSADRKLLAIHYLIKKPNLDTNAVGLWDLGSGKYLKTISVPEFNLLEFTPDGKYFAISSPGGQEQLFFGIDSGRNEFSIADKSTIKDSKFIKSSIFATTNDTQPDDGSKWKQTDQIVMWDLKSKRILQQINTDNKGEIGSLAYFESSNVLVSGGTDGTLKFYDMTRNILIDTFNKAEQYSAGSGPKSVQMLKVWPTNDKLAVFLKNGDIKFYQVEISE